MYSGVPLLPQASFGWRVTVIPWERTGPMLFPVKHPKDDVFHLMQEFVRDAFENCD